MSIKVGDNAPEFTLPNTEREEISLSEFKGNKNVLILFFPFAFTGVCTKELCSTRDNLKVYENMNAEVLAISVDSPFTLGKFKEENKLNFNVLSDFNKNVSNTFDAIYKDFLGFSGVAKRSAFVVDKSGVVRYAEVLDNAGDLPNFEAIQSTLSELD
ncbi:MAG TPA: peroxiredoxin [Balneolales bacterium]|nr:peroxiredoxin [Balneolales bacterium]